jgi:beta-lactamase regulating signal transducer with metallopeptidase domain
MMSSILVRAALEGTIVVALVWIVSRTWHRLSPSTQAILWWCAAVKFLVALIWTAPVTLPLLPASARVIPQHIAIARQDTTTQSAIERPARDASVIQRRIDWTSLLLTLWTIGCLAAAGMTARRWRQTLAVTSRASRAPAHVLAMAVELGDRLGLDAIPAIRFSDDVDTPLVAGFRQPTVLLPQRFGDLPVLQQQMALCHELAHVKRRDLWFGCAPALAEHLFFFHPFVRLAAREYAFWREAACDAAVIAALGAAPQEYGRLLLDLGVTRRRPAFAAASASWSFLNLQRRIGMLRHAPGRPLVAHLLTASAIAIGIAAMVPIRLTARQNSFSELASPATAAAVPGVEQPRDRTLNYVVFVDESRTTMSSGSTADIEHARRHRQGSERLMWFRHNGREYVVRDPRVVEQVIAIWHPVSELGNEQGRVGGEQGALGAKQGAIGAKQGELGAEQGRLGARQGMLGARQGELAARQAAADRTESGRRAFEKEQRDIEEEMDAVDREMRKLTEKMDELNKPMEDLSDQMEVLGKEMDVLGRKMEEASKKADQEMMELLDRLVSSGGAESVK